MDFMHVLLARAVKLFCPPVKALPLCLLAMCLLTAATAAFLLPGTAQAQEGAEYEYVDLVMVYEYDGNVVVYSVQNIGTATATGVAVSFLLEDLQTDTFEVSRGPHRVAHPPTDKRTENSTNQRFTWEVGTILSGETSLSLKFGTRLHSGHTTADRVGVITAEASSVQLEPGFLLANNVSKVYSFAESTTGSTLHMDGNKLALLLSVSDLRPNAGGDVNFDLTARNLQVEEASVYINIVDEIEIKVELSEGLEFKTTQEWTRPTGFVTSGRSATWKPEPTDGKPDPNTFANYPFSRNIEIKTELTSDSLNDIPREERCITAWVSDGRPDPNPDYLLGSLKQCLGDDPPVLLNSGIIDLLTVHRCVKVNSQILYPCRDSEDDGAIDNALELVAKVEAAMARADGIGRFDAGTTSEDWRILVRPEVTVVQVNDPEGRREASGNIVWNSGSQSTGTNAVGLFPGVVLGVELPYDDFTDKSYSFSISDMTPGGKPGSMKAVGAAFKAATVLDADKSAQPTFSGNPGGGAIPLWFEFGELGTYKMNITIGHAGGSPSGTYTFHVGPMAELKVRDGGASPHAPADRNALTIFAFNNGPDRSLGARVTGLPKGAEVFHVSHGSYDGTAGAWNTGELEDSEYLGVTGRPEHATLVLGAAAGDTANVTIKNSVDYKVCIGSDASTLAHTTETACEAVTGASWHEGTVYDYDAGNNTATITATRGTGGVGPGIPGNPRTQTGTTTVMWDDVEFLYGLPVARYEVQWLGSDWTMLGDAVIENQHADAAPSGRRDYRVRAVNLAGVAGPWSGSTVTVQAGHAGPPVNLRAQADGNNAIDVSWDAPEDTGGSAITGYTVQWSADGSEGSWRNAGSVSDLTFKHRSLQVGAIRYYRVAARNSSGLGLWSDPVMGQTVSGAPNAPTLSAKALSDYQIELTWTEPKDNGQAITGYRIDYSADGSADSWSRLATPGAATTTYTDETLRANIQRYYRIRAINSVGDGAWSRTVSARTQLEPPTAPTIIGVEADGPNAIVVTWTDPLLYEGELGITQYQVQYAKDQYSEIWRGPQTLSSSVRSWRHTGLKPGETWYYQVRASNGGGRWSVWSYIESATTASDNAPKGVSGFRAQYDKDMDHFALTWNDLSGNGATFSYEVERSEDGSDWRSLTTVATCDAGKCAYEDTDLWPGAKLYYRVRAVNDEGDKGPWSNAQSATRPPNAPDAPRLNWVEADGSNHIVIEWEPPYFDGGTAITGYRLLWCRSLDGADDDPCQLAESNSPAHPAGYSAISLGALARTYTHSVSPGYWYHYLLRATNGGNRWSEWQEHDIYYARTYAGTPAAPGLTARAVASDQIKLTWNKPNSYGSEISEYWLYIYNEGDNLYDFDNILDILRVPGDRTEWTVGDLSPGTTRYFRIRALNDNGEGKYSTLRQAATPSG